MKNNQIFLGDAALNLDIEDVKGEFVSIKEERYYKISNYDQMSDFFMTIVSDSNHWLFISSNGSLSAGRKDRDNALFPYYTVDKIHDYCGITGSKTIVRVESEHKTFLWQPFNKDLSGIYKIERNIYKNIYGNKIIFQEINKDLGLSFEYCWCTSDKFGIIKKSNIKNINTKNIKIEILDGISNILPSGIDYVFQNEFSNLLDSYKKNELIEETNLGLFFLSSVPVDRAEPSESLTATTVWSAGLEKVKILLSNNQLDKFKKGLPIHTENDIRARRGAYYIVTKMDLEENNDYQWKIISEVNQNSTAVANLNCLIKNSLSLEENVEKDIEKGSRNLIYKVASSDGIQFSNEELCSVSHFSKTLFNILRGGIYNDGYIFNVQDFIDYVYQTNRKVSQKIEGLSDNLSTKVSKRDLLIELNKFNDSNLIRIYYEYLPLSFSRRHGDPSRPWNKFSIDNKNADGSEKLDYQGNWRDIFQNWEALSISYPEFIENIICKFVNASTADGYNPYRIMRNGIDWECPDPNDPWAYIGYWGDHQIIYLQKLLELSNKYHPGKLIEFLSKDIFTFANVPYKIKSFKDIKKNPKDTIEFDYELNKKIENLVDEIGSDAKLILNKSNEVYYVNFTEKILITLLVKLSNFIPEAGIWLNTQRPEWNDANNALVGNGASMVTLYYLRRFINFWNQLFSKMHHEKFKISNSLRKLFDKEFKVFFENSSKLLEGFSDKDRLTFANTLGVAGEQYRKSVYDKSFINSYSNISTKELIEFTQLVLSYIDQSIKANKRNDGLYHAYNIIHFESEGISINYLYEMLEGQVAVLSSSCLTSEESLNVLKALRHSALYREDQNSYLLYPNRDLTKFIDKNNISEKLINKSKLLLSLIKDKDNSVITLDKNNKYHFHEAFRNSEIVEKTLNNLDKSKYRVLVEEEKTFILNIYEDVFNHKSFTGRSGTFYGYEGLGSIYWHMVSKLLLATQECYFNAIKEKRDKNILIGLKDFYYHIKDGIGLYKSPKSYGSFPYDPYSHTPGNSGVKQPGMTGQVKEDIISRMGELGVIVNNGEISFDTSLINTKEFLTKEKTFTYFSLKGEQKDIILSKNQLGFTLCQIPIIYSLNGLNKIKVYYKNGKIENLDGNLLNSKISSNIFNRIDEINFIEVEL